MADINRIDDDPAVQSEQLYFTVDDAGELVVRHRLLGLSAELALGRDVGMEEYSGKWRWISQDADKIVVIDP